MRRVKLAGPGAALAPIQQIFPFARKFHYARVAVAIGNINLALRREGDVGGTVESLGVGSGLAFDAPGAQELTLIGELHHLVIAVVGDPDVVLFIDAQAVGIAEDTLAPRAQIFALGVE